MFWRKKVKIDKDTYDMFLEYLNNAYESLEALFEIEKERLIGREIDPIQSLMVQTLIAESRGEIRFVTEKLKESAE